MKEDPKGTVSDDDARRAQVRERYGGVATRSSPCCGEGAGAPCCGDTDLAIQLGYSPAQLADLPEGADLGLGCGNPTAILGLSSGQSVLDLGSGAGIDCFLAAKKVGARGSVLGVDMTPEMVAKARENARKGSYPNVEFRLGEIEHLPVGDASIDVVISNCVICLAPDKEKVYREAFRVLRPGGRLAFSDMVATRPISADQRADASLWLSCASGALEVNTVKRLLRRLGFVDVAVELRTPEKPPNSLQGESSLGVVSADIQARKPGE
ncbi:MAG: arsenite methyltransferase [Thermoplasmata archaeon]